MGFHASTCSSVQIPGVSGYLLVANLIIWVSNIKKAHNKHLLIIVIDIRYISGKKFVTLPLGRVGDASSFCNEKTSRAGSLGIVQDCVWLGHAVVGPLSG